MSESKTAFVTGASRGIGKAIAIALAQGGFDAVARWLATAEGAVELSGQTVFAQHFCVEHGLVPGYPGPKPTPPANPDPAPAQFASYSAAAQQPA